MSTERQDRTIRQLDCGLVVIAQRIAVPNVATTQCWVKAGSIYDGELSGAGLSHFLEHMLACGSTSTRTAAEIRAILAKLGAQSNAVTGHDTVHYYVDTTATDAPVAIELLSDWMQHALFFPAEFNVQRGVIENELATGRDEPGRVLSALTLAARYGDHPACYPIIGERDAFLALTLDQVRSSYETMYAPNNMAFVIAGDIDPEQMVAEVSKQWRGLRPRAVPELALPLPPSVDGPTLLRGYAAGERPRLRLVWPGARLGADGDRALDVLARILGQGALSRLATTVRDQRRLASSVAALHLSFPWGKGLFTVDAVPSSATLDEVGAAVQSEIDKIRHDGVTSDELARAKRKLVSAECFVSQTVRAAAGRMGRDFIQTGDPDALDRYAAAIHEVDLASVSHVVEQFLGDDHLLTIHLLNKPEDARRPEVARPVAPGGAKPDATERVMFDNTPLVQKMRTAGPTLTKRVALSVAPATREVLPNGLRVVVQRDTRLPIVAMEWHQVGGLLADQPGQEGIANAVAMMRTRGAGRHSAGDISRATEELGASLSSGCTHSTSFVKAECLAGDWRRVLGLLSDGIQQPRFVKSEWANIKPRILTAIAVHNESWHRHLLAAIREAYFEIGHPWSQIDLGRTQVIQRLDRDDLERFHLAHVAASESALVVIGDVVAEDVLAEVAREFGQMRSRPIVPLTRPRPGGVQPKRLRVITNKTLAAAQLAYGPGLTRQCPEYSALLVMNKVLVDGAAGGWLADELRGLVYVLSVGMMAGAAPGYWALMFSCQPGGVHEAVTKALRIVDRVRTERVDKATLESAKTNALLSEALGLQSNGQRAKAFALDEVMGYGFDDTLKLGDAIRSVDANAVRDTAVRYLDTFVSVELGHPRDAGDLVHPVPG